MGVSVEVQKNRLHVYSGFDAAMKADTANGPHEFYSKKQVDNLLEKNHKESIQLTPAEIQSGVDRVQWAKGLIEQLPTDHDGRNSWLMNYGNNADNKEKTT